MALNESDIAHLIRRTEIIATPARIAELAALPTREAAVDSILEKNSAGNPSTPVGTTKIFELDGNTWEYISDLRRWWLDEMAFGAQPLREKMTLFWQGHFTSSEESSGWFHHILFQFNLYRANAFGNFREFTKLMSIEPLMLHYLNNDGNTKWERNENFARELLELFTLGLNHYGLISGQDAPYTQADVVSASKAWTGHNLQWYETKKSEYIFRSGSHLDETITFLGKTGKFDNVAITKDYNEFSTIDHLLTTSPYNVIAARYIATKLWSFFAYPNPDAAMIASIVDQTGFAMNMNIKALLRGILVHPSFYSDTAKLGLIATPAEFVARGLAACGERRVTETNHRLVDWYMADMAQELFNPPNVAGWKQNAYWLSTSELGARGNALRQIFDLPASQTKFADLEGASVDAAITEAARRLGIVSLQAQTRSNLTSWLTSERARSGSSSAFRSSSLMHLLLMSPDLQLS